MRTKLLSILVIILILSVVLVGCHNRNNLPNSIKDDNAIIQTIKNDLPETSSKQVKNEIIGEALVIPISIDEAIISANIITYAELRNIEYFGIYDVYEYKIIKTLKGGIEEDTIYVNYVNVNNNKKHYNEVYKVNGRYILTLTRDRNIFYDRDMYKNYGGLDVCVDNNSKITQLYEYQKLQNKKNLKSVKDFEEFIKTCMDNKPRYTNLRKVGNDMNILYTDNVEELYEGSTVVAEVRVTGIIRKSKELSTGKFTACSIDVKQLYKGKIDNKARVHLFNNDFEVGKQYIVFLEPYNQKNQMFNPSSKYSCIPLTDTKTYEEYMKFIDKKQ